MNEGHNRQQTKRALWMVMALGVVAALIAVLVRLWQRWRAEKPPEVPAPRAPVIPPDLRGLTETEAESRRLQGQDNIVSFHPPRSRGEIWRDNTFNIFNLSLVGIAFVQLLLGLYLDALISVGVAIFSIAINVAQEMLVRRRLKGVELKTRPRATVIREERARGIDPNRIVQGDVLVIGPGDQILADGELLTERPVLIDESMVTGKGDRLTKRGGDAVYAGSFCVSGRAAYKALRVGNERRVVKMLESSQAKQKTLTPLEQIMGRVLRVMLVIVVLMISLLLSRYFRLDEAMDISVDVLISRASVIFSLAPAGLYFMVFLNYVSATADLARQGALVHRARSVETLAHATHLCITQAGTRLGAQVRLEDIEAPEDDERPAGSRLHQILGDYSRSSTAVNQALRALADAFPGERRLVQEETTFLSVYGWMGVVFNDEDLRGAYILGEQSILQEYLVEEKGPETVEAEAQVSEQASSLRKRLSSLGRFLRRSDEVPEQQADQDGSQEANEPAQGLEQGSVDLQEAQPAEAEQAEKNALRRLFSRVGLALKRQPATTGGEAEEEEITAQEPVEEVVYLFAYYPDLLSLHDASGQPRLSAGLIPLCRLHFTQQIRSEMVDAARTLVETGVIPKLFWSGAPDRMTALLQRAGLLQGDDEREQVITGSELADLEPEALASVAKEKTLFAYVTPEQTGQLVTALRQGGESVAVLGRSPSDLPVMRKSDLSISTQGSSQAALSVADIVLLEDSPEVLLRILEKGQKIVNGLLDVLKLYLTQLIYLTLLIVLIALPGLGFPYNAAQGGIIAIVTLTMPALGLSFWARSGALHSPNLSRSLARFSGPAALSISLAALGLYIFILENSGEMVYAQLVLTHMLVISGLVLAILVRPPALPGNRGDAQAGDRRTVILILVVLVLFYVFAAFPIAYEFFKLKLLRQPQDYLVVVLATLAWVVAVSVVWRIFPHQPVREASTHSRTHQADFP